VFTYADGFVAIPTGPGLGIDINEDYVTERAQQGHGATPTGATPTDPWPNGDGSHRSATGRTSELAFADA
jgi:hypothetical protein